jgi:hypothetical protein
MCPELYASSVRDPVPEAPQKIRCRRRGSEFKQRLIMRNLEILSKLRNAKNNEIARPS